MEIKTMENKTNTEIQNQEQRPIDVIASTLNGEHFMKQMQLITGRSEAEIRRYATKVIYAIMTDRTASYTLMKCSKESIARSVITSASLGLDIDAKEHAYLVPYWNKHKKCHEAQFMPGYKGYIYKAKKSPEIKDIQCHIVYSGDTFKVSMGTDPKLEHIPDIMAAGYGKFENMIAVYSVVFFKNGMTNFEIMTRDQCLKIRDDLEKKFEKESNIWRNNPGEMSRKTVTRRHAKRLQLEELEDLAIIDDAVSEGRMVSKSADNGMIEFHDDIGGEGDPDSEFMDRSSTPEKENYIKQIEAYVNALNYNSAKQIKLVNKFLKVPEIKYSKIENLKKLYEYLKEKIKTKNAEENDADSKEKK